MAAVLPELEALDDLEVIDEWEHELWACDTIPLIDLPSIPYDNDEVTQYANDYLSACWTDEQEEDHTEDFAPWIKRRFQQSTPTKPPKVRSIAIQTSAWSIDESVRQSESQDRIRLFARMCNAEARLSELEHAVVGLTNHTNLRFTQVYSGQCFHEKRRNDTVADVLARAKKINFVPALPKIDTYN